MLSVAKYVYEILLCFFSIICKVIGSQLEFENALLFPETNLHEDSMSAWELEQEQKMTILERRSVLRQQMYHVNDEENSGIFLDQFEQPTIITHITSQVIFDFIRKYLTLEDFVGLYTVNTHMYNFLRRHYLVGGQPILNLLRFYPSSLGSLTIHTPPSLETHVVKTTDREHWESIICPLTVLYEYFSLPIQAIVVWKDDYHFEPIPLLWCRVIYEIEHYRLHLNFFPAHDFIDPYAENMQQYLYHPIVIQNAIIPTGYIHKETGVIYQFAWFDLPLNFGPDESNLELSLDGDLKVEVVYQQIYNPANRLVVTLLFTYDYHCKVYTDQQFWFHPDKPQDCYESILRMFKFPKINDKRGSIYIKHYYQ